MFSLAISYLLKSFWTCDAFSDCLNSKMFEILQHDCLQAHTTTSLTSVTKTDGVNLSLAVCACVYTWCGCVTKLSSPVCRNACSIDSSAGIYKEALLTCVNTSNCGPPLPFTINNITVWRRVPYGEFECHIVLGLNQVETC